MKVLATNRPGAKMLKDPMTHLHGIVAWNYVADVLLIII